MTVKKKEGEKYVLVAPDGGWGYMICLAALINVITISGFMNCFGIIFKELFVELNMDSTSITLFNGINCFTIAVSAFMTSSLLKLMSIRQVGLLSAFIFNIGVFGTVFVKSQFLFFFCQGFLQSIGHGIIFNLSFTMLNYYFVKRRLLAVSFTQTCVATSAFLSPLFVNWTTETYGYRGTFLLISAISLHNILAMTMMQPVSCHMRRIEITENRENETKLLLVKDIKCFNDKEDLKSCTKSFDKSEIAAEEATEHINKVDDKANGHNSRLKKLVFHIVDVPLFRSLFLTNACVGNAVIMFAEMTFTLMVPLALYDMGWNENQVAWAVSLNALGDLVTRVLVIFLSNLLSKYGSSEIYVTGLAIAFGSRIGMLWSDNHIAISTFMAVMGISRCTIMVFSTVVVSEVVSSEKYSAAMGFYFLLYGLFNLIIGPIVGAVRDLTDSYPTALYILTSLYAIVAIFWSIELLYKKSKHKRIPKTNP